MGLEDCLFHAGGVEQLHLGDFNLAGTPAEEVGGSLIWRIGGPFGGVAHLLLPIDFRQIGINHLAGIPTGPRNPVVEPDGHITERAHDLKGVGDEDDGRPRPPKAVDALHTLALERLIAHGQHLVGNQDVGGQRR